MKTFVIFVLLLGIIFIMQGYYNKKIETIEKKKVIIKYIPLNIYEGNMNGEESIDNHFKSQFEKITEK
jgi:hypothetical protein